MEIAGISIIGLRIRNPAAQVRPLNGEEYCIPSLVRNNITMKILFVGGTGIISTACVELAAQRGMEVFVLNRGQTPGKLPQGVKLIRADIHNESQTAAALEGKHFDVVAAFFTYTAADVERDIRLFAGKTAQYCFISSASAYQKPTTHYLITESTPLHNPFNEYSRNKIASEARLTAEYRRNGFPMVIVRPSWTYGDTNIPLTISSLSHPWSCRRECWRASR